MVAEILDIHLSAILTAASRSWIESDPTFVQIVEGILVAEDGLIENSSNW